MTIEEIKKLLSPHLDQASVQTVFDSIDVDQNGKIFWNEFLAATISQAIYLKEANLKEAFNNFDQQKKGFFGINEIVSALDD